jgi:hypothetical protein
MAVVRHRLQRRFADLGRLTYERLSAGQLPELASDARAADLRASLVGLEAEMRLKEEELRQVFDSRCRCCGGQRSEPETGQGPA